MAAARRPRVPRRSVHTPMHYGGHLRSGRELLVVFADGTIEHRTFRRVIEMCVNRRPWETCKKVVENICVLNVEMLRRVPDLAKAHRVSDTLCSSEQLCIPWESREADLTALRTTVDAFSQAQRDAARVTIHEIFHGRHADTLEGLWAAHVRAAARATAVVQRTWRRARADLRTDQRLRSPGAATRIRAAAAQAAASHASRLRAAATVQRAWRRHVARRPAVRAVLSADILTALLSDLPLLRDVALAAGPHAEHDASLVNHLVGCVVRRRTTSQQPGEPLYSPATVRAVSKDSGGQWQVELTVDGRDEAPTRLSFISNHPDAAEFAAAAVSPPTRGSAQLASALRQREVATRLRNAMLAARAGGAARNEWHRLLHAARLHEDEPIEGQSKWVLVGVHSFHARLFALLFLSCLENPKHFLFRRSYSS